jgi:hypothetical protein
MSPVVTRKGKIMRGLKLAEQSDRRIARGRFLLLLMAMLVVLFGPLAQQADASKAWCRTDPVVVIGGQITDIFVAGPLSALLVATGPTEIVVTVPTGVDAWLLLPDLGFGKGVNVSFEESSSLSTSRKGVQVEVAVFVPASEDIPIRVEVAPRVLGILWPATTEGTANQWLALSTSV